MFTTFQILGMKETMFCADDDDASLKTPIVRPSDVLDIEVSPVAHAPLTTWRPGSESKQKLQKITVKSKIRHKKSSWADSSSNGLKKQLASPMKRGDPFLPSVFFDENPIADYTVKKNSRKKPSDCKCKGFGYNLSPSALLPEEMRQQWGVGMFGKPTLVKTNSVVTSNNTTVPMTIAPSSRETEPKYPTANIIRNNSGCSSSNCCILRCKNCMKEPCSCFETFVKHEGFRIPETGDRRKHKSVAKGSSLKLKENKSPSSVVLGSNSTTSMLKRIACYNSKDNSNIISTSNFSRNGISPVSLNGHGSQAADSSCYKSGSAIGQSGIGNSRCSSLNGTSTCSIKNYGCAQHEDFAITARARHRHQSRPSRRVLSNISPSPIISSNSLGGSSGNFEPKKSLSRSAAQMLMLGSQGCACDSCRRRSSLMSRMEALGFSTSHAQQMLSPFMFPSSQRYQSATIQSALSTPARYAPYSVPAYGYRTPGNIYRSPDRYRCSSPPYYDYTDAPSVRRHPFTNTPLSMAYEMNKMDTSSYLDSENSLPSPPPSGYVEDITDLSIKDTVDFFVSMKSPFVNGSPSPASDASSGMYSSFSPGERCVSPNYTSESSSCFCTTGVCSSYSMSHRRESGFNESSNMKFTGTESQPQPMSLLYSSLVSDLEDELRCAIENIPTG